MQAAPSPSSGVALDPAEDLQAEGFAPAGLHAVATAVRSDIATGAYGGAVLLLSRDGGPPWVFSAGSAAGRPLRRDAVFNLYSISKAFTNVLLFRCFDKGLFAADTRIAELIPEFSGEKRDLLTVRHLLSHTSGMLPMFAPRKGMHVDRLDEVIQAICAGLRPVRNPGEAVWYSPMVSHALLGEAIRRSDARERSFGQIAREDLFAPLRMHDSSFGLPERLRTRYVAPELAPDSLPMEYLGRHNPGPWGALEQEDSEIPALGAVTTVENLFRFAEMLRCGGILEGHRIVSAEVLDEARTVCTGDLLHELYLVYCMKRHWKLWPANFGWGFQLRGTAAGHYHCGSRASPATFFQVGIGSSMFWIDPVREVTCIMLTTPVIGEADSILRFERLSDLVHTAVV